MLSVIDLISQGIIKDKYIPISDELIETFKKYWNSTANSEFKGSDFALPFFYLKNGMCKFWHLKYSSEYDGGRPQTIPKLRQDVDCAYFDEELFCFIKDEITRKDLIDVLVSSWFSNDGSIAEESITLNQNIENTLLIDELMNAKTSPQKILKNTLIRDAFFRKSIIHVYDYKCAFCGLKVIKPVHQNIVDGAHIKPFAQFYDSRIHNGIALCKNHHWAFDRGWFTVDNQYKILISKGLEEISPHAKPMKDFHGEQLLLPHKEQYFPSLEALQWHQQNIFQA